jgi:hypothetical protein
MELSDWINLVSAVGTVGATLVALYLALNGNMRHVDGTFIWEASTEYQPTLLVQNTSTRIIVIDSIEIKYSGKQVGIIKASDDRKLAQQAIIEAGQIKRISINIRYLDIKDLPNREKRHCLKVIIKLRSGRRHTSKQKYSYDELLGLLFGQALFSED